MRGFVLPALLFQLLPIAMVSSEVNLTPSGDMEYCDDLRIPLPVWNRMDEPLLAEGWRLSVDQPVSSKACICTETDQEFYLGTECPGGKLTGRAMVRAEKPDTPVILRVSWYDRLKRQDKAETFRVGTQWQEIRLAADGVIDGPCEIAIRPEKSGMRIWVDDIALLAGKPTPNPMTTESPIQPRPIDLLKIQKYSGDGRSKSGEIPLLLDIPDEKAFVSPVVSTGIPFPKGHLFSPDNVRILADGEELHCQTDVLARWHGDSSIEVLLITIPVSAATPREMKLEYGPDIERKQPQSTLKVTSKDGGHLVDTGILSFELSPNSSGPSDIKLRGRSIASDSGAVIIGLDGNRMGSDLLEPATISIERSGPLMATFCVRARIVNDEKEPVFSSDLRVTAFSGSPRLLLQQSITNISREPYETIRAMGFTLDKTEKSEQEVAMTAWQRDKKLGATYVVGGEAKDLTREQVDGAILCQNSGGEIGLSVRDFCEHYPCSIEAKGNRLSLWIWPADSSPAVCLSQGISKTRDFVLDFDGQTLKYHTKKTPLLMSSAEWYCSTGLFNYLLPPDEKTFPIFEKRVGSLSTVGLFSWQEKDQRWLYGCFNYGDAHGDGGWSNLETMAAHELFLHYFRTLSRQHYEGARLAAEHHRDVDIHHGLGFCHTHCSNHTKSGEGWSHSWIQGIKDLYFLTGDGRCLDVLNEVGTCLLSKEYGFRSGRDWTRPIDNLVDIYSATNDPHYLEAALGHVRVLRQRQEPDKSICGAEKGSWYEDRYSAGSAFTWYGCLAMAKLHQNVGGDDLKDTFLRELDLSMDVATKGKRSYDFYQDQDISELKRAEVIGEFALGRGSVVFPPIGYAYRVTGDRKYLDIGIKVLAFCLMMQRGGSDASATSFMTAFLREAKLAGFDATAEAAAFQAARDFAWEQQPRTLLNGDLEKGTFENWSIKKVPGQNYFYDKLVRVGWYVDDEVVHRGKYSLRFHSDNYGRVMSTDCRMALPPGRRWRASVWIKAQEGMNPQASFSLKEYDTDTGWGGAMRPTGRTENGWNELAVDFITGNRAVGLLSFSHRNGTGDCWFDTGTVEDMGPTQ